MDFEIVVQLVDNLLECCQTIEASLPAASKDNLEHISDGLRTALSHVESLIDDNSLESEQVASLVPIRSNLQTLCPLWVGHLQRKMQEEIVCPTDESGSRGRPRFIVLEEQVSA